MGSLAVLETPVFSTDQERWDALVARDRSADGHFYYAVKTTGVYCRPSCGARTPLRENVAFYDSTTSAQSAGFRACKRCKPGQMSLEAEHASIVARACAQLEQSEEVPALEELAAAAGLSAFHFHRVFKAVTGLTPRAYAAAHRAGRVRDGLTTARSVTEAIYDAGFNSSGRFYAASDQMLGMTPSSFRAGGRGAAIQFAVAECSLGSVLVAATEKGICATLLGDDPDELVQDLQRRFPAAQLRPGEQKFEETVARVVGLVENPKAGHELPLDVKGTAFQHRVWQALREIPAGVTCTYSEIAERIGAPRSVRAVAQACASNSVAIAIPCHRVVRSDGNLSGYRWGVERKQTLLEREGAR